MGQNYENKNEGSSRREKNTLFHASIIRNKVKKCPALFNIQSRCNLKLNPNPRPRLRHLHHVSYCAEVSGDVPLAATLVLRFARAAARILAGSPPAAGEGLLSELGDRRVEPTLDRSFVTDGSTWI
jgi:hypothetical protein